MESTCVFHVKHFKGGQERADCLKVYFHIFNKFSTFWRFLSRRLEELRFAETELFHVKRFGFPHIQQVFHNRRLGEGEIQNFGGVDKREAADIAYVSRETLSENLEIIHRFNKFSTMQKLTNGRERKAKRMIVSRFF